MSVLRTKPIRDVLAQGSDEGGEPRSRLRRRLGALDLMGFGIGIVIGTGIFTLTGIEAKNHAGPGVVVSFAIGGVVALLAALCYAELAASVPTAGSAYTYAYATMGEIVAWIIGWDLLLEFALGSAVVARGWSGYLADLFGLPSAWFAEEGSVVNLGAIAIVLILGVVATVGIRESARITNLLVLVKVAICVFIVVAGLFLVKATNLSPFIPAAEPAGGGEDGVRQPVTQAIFGLEPSVFGFAGVLTAAAVVFFAYTGFEAVANLGEETRKPRRDLPLGLLGTLLISTVLYIGVSLVVVGMVRYTDIDEGAPIASAFKAAGAGWAAVLVSIAAIAGLTSVILVELVAMGRIGFAIARDGLIPPSIARVHPRWGTPYRISAIVTVGVALLAGFLPLAALADLVSIGALGAFLLVSVAVPTLRRRRPELERPFTVPFSPVLPIVSALACFYLMLNLSVETWLRFLAWMLLGAAIYFGYGHRRNRLARREAGGAGVVPGRRPVEQLGRG
ncbi:basic amino acid/polyamine antiporter, APA family [Micromonospora viridifaciens]|uniref:Basic amino acid/polyamine antiporter, APA family n=1 Tax=Micromonospora viridifaciens TaxID=1881 RepID=A0A1C4UY49_MICVI|nr:amino acid permease [Micromonospora viridifaciens]SCE76602.1 basic amino acid/polyamine antiporter, APA family [Micromonospora viridifaciens]